MCSVSLQLMCHLLDEQAEVKKKATAKRKRESEAEEELDKLKTKKARLEQDVKTLEKSADKLAEKAETTHNHKLIMESNAIRRSAKKKKEEVVKLTTDIETKVKEMSNL